MSGDVQPRKRKDKKKKRESFDVRKSEGELIFSRKSSLQEDEASHGVHFTKMGSDDVHLHIHEEHGTGGDWCAKIIFFSLMTIIMGLVCMIILENRGISNVDTPLSKSRFSNYFDGWVDENRDDHDDHHDTHGSLEHDDDHDEHDDDEDHDEPFEEEADHSEGDEEIAEEEDENVTPEEEDKDDNATAENVTGEKDEEEDDEENITAEEDNATAEDENVTEEATVELNDEDDENDDNKTNEDDEDGNATTETSKPTTSQAVEDDDDDAFEEEDDDGAFDSLEKMVDNDAAEIDLLKEKARQQAAAESKENLISAENDLQDEAENAPSWASSLAVKIGVGLALALVARLVLIRKNPISNEAAPVPEHLMTRRLTIASPDEFIPGDADVIDEPLPEDDYSEEEIEIEEEIEYIEEDVEATGEENQVDAGDNDYAPETFEQLNAMYRSKDYKEETQKQIETTQSTKPEPYSYQSSYSTSSNNNNNRHNNNNSDTKIELPKSSNNSYNKNTQHQAVSKVVASPPLAEAKIDVQAKYSPPKEVVIKSETSKQPLKKDVTYDMDYEKTEKEKPTVEHKKEISHDMDYQPDADEIDYDEDDIYDDDEAQDDDSEDLDDDDLLDDDEEDLEEGDDDEEVSDVDDTELMNRLEAKYGKLPAKEYQSDEDPDDPTWTRNY